MGLINEINTLNFFNGSCPLHHRPTSYKIHLIHCLKKTKKVNSCSFSLLLPISHPFDSILPHLFFLGKCQISRSLLTQIFSLLFFSSSPSLYLFIFFFSFLTNLYFSVLFLFRYHLTKPIYRKQ